MAKTSSKPEIEISNEEVEQIEDSALLASDFLHDVLLPMLDEFENHNDDDDYMSGLATHGLFVAIVQRMLEMGYTERDLKKEIKTYAQLPIGVTIH